MEERSATVFGLMTLNTNYCDEFDIESVCLISKREYEETMAILESGLLDDQDWFFGTNEFVSFERFANDISWEELSKDEVSVLRKTVFKHGHCVGMDFPDIVEALAEKENYNFSIGDEVICIMPEEKGLIVEGFEDFSVLVKSTKTDEVKRIHRGLVQKDYNLDKLVNSIVDEWRGKGGK